jgi:DNA-binding NtrC family response regulator
MTHISQWTHGMRYQTILVIDDNRDTCAFARKCLTTAGYSVITAAGGTEGLRVFSEHQSKIALLLTDVAMPDLGGFELADRVLAIYPRLPVLFMTGGPWRPYREFECVAKPFLSTELVASVSRALNRNIRSESAPAAQPYL